MDVAPTLTPLSNEMAPKRIGVSSVQILRDHFRPREMGHHISAAKVDLKASDATPPLYSNAPPHRVSEKMLQQIFSYL